MAVGRQLYYPRTSSVGDVIPRGPIETGYLGLILVVVVCGTAGVMVSPAESAPGWGGEPAGVTAGGVDPELAEATGTVAVVVRFEAPELVETNRSVRALRRVSAEAHRPFETFARETGGVSVEETFWITPAALVTVDTDRVSLGRLAGVEGVTRVHHDVRGEVGAGVDRPDQTRTGLTQPVGSSQVGDPAVTWPLRAINVTAAWSRFDTRGSGTTVAVLDSGVAVDAHDELAPIAGGWRDFVNQRSEPYDDLGHGTHVTGIVAGARTADGSRYGVAPEVRLVHGKILDENNRWRTSRLLEGFEWVTTHEADIDVLVASLFSNADYDVSLVDPVRNARANGIAVVGIAGNSGPGTSTSPGNVFEALSVGATDSNGEVWAESGGTRVETAEAWRTTAPSDWPAEYLVPDVVAPGAGVRSADHTGGYTRWWGTSMAAPHVGGTIALMESASNRDLTVPEIRRALRATASAPTDSPNTRYGYGVVDAHDAVDAVAGRSPSLDVTLSVDEQVPVDGSATVTVTVTGTGETAVTRTLRIEVGGEPVVSGSLTVPANNTETVTEEVTLGSGEPGRAPVLVAVGETVTTRTVRVVEPPTFELVELNTGSVTVGEQLVVRATVTNTGGVTGTRTVNVETGGEQVTTAELTLEPANRRTVTGRWTPGADDTGEQTVLVTVGERVVEETVEVLRSATFEVEQIEVDGPVAAGDPVTVKATVRNTGDSAGRSRVIADIGTETTRSRSLALGGGESRRVAFEFQSVPVSAGTYTVTVTAGEDTALLEVRAGGDDTGPADGSGPGFSPLTALVACLVGGAGLYRRHRAVTATG